MTTASEMMEAVRRHSDLNNGKIIYAIVTHSQYDKMEKENGQVRWFFKDGSFIDYTLDGGFK